MRLFPGTADANAKRLIGARALRAVADGYVSILLPAYLLALGLDAFEVGVLTTATLLGSAGLTLLAGLVTARFGHRRPLLAAAGLMVLTGLGFAGLQAFWPLLLIAFVGTINPSTGDVSVPNLGLIRLQTQLHFRLKGQSIVQSTLPPTT
jgi:MFS family permease